MLCDGTLVWQRRNLPRRNRFKLLAGPMDPTGPEPGTFERTGSAFSATSLFAAADDLEVGRDTMTVRGCREGSTMIVAVGIDTGLDIGIGIGDWADVFEVVLLGLAVPYRWDDMYHQKPGFAVCLYVCSMSFIIASGS